MPRIDDSHASRERAAFQRRISTIVRASVAPIAKRLRKIEQAVSSLPRFYIGKVTVLTPFTVTVRPGDEGSWDIVQPARSKTYTPALNDWALVVDLGRAVRLDPGGGGRLVLFAFQLGA